MAFWNLYYYVQPDGDCPYGEWLAELPDDVKGHIEDKMDYLESAPRHNSNLIDTYKGWPGILEFKPTFKNVPYRPLICRHPRDGKGFVFLEGTIEQRWKIPKAQVVKADTRRKNLFEDTSRAKPREEI